MKKKFTLLFSICLVTAAMSQTIIYSNSFNNASGWSLGAANNSDTWIVNSVYNCSTPTPNAGGGGYLHIYDDLGGEMCAYAGYYGLGGGGTCYASMTSDISTTGYSDITISFSWLCAGNTAITPSYGQIQYSTNSGGNWTTITSPRTNYNGQSTWTTATITSSAVPALANQATLRLRFSWTSSGYGSNPAFAIDNLSITGAGGSCTNTGGTAVANPSAICNGQTSTLSLTGSNGTIQWQESPNGTSGWTNVSGGSGATTTSYTTASLSATKYYRAVLSATGCSDANSNTVSVTVNPSVTPAFSITASPSDTFCTGGTLTFTAGNLANEGTSPSFQWKINSNNSSTGNPFTPASLNDQDMVSCEMTSNVLCATSSTAQSNIITVNERALPPAPTITQSNDTLESSPAVAYQWYRNNGMIPGANGQQYLLTDDGVYEVEITDAFGCKSKSASFNVIGTSIKRIDGGHHFQIYPQPTSGSFVVEFTKSENRNIQIADATGRVIYSAVSDGTRHPIALDHAADGLYILTVRSSEGQQSARVQVAR